MLFYNLGSCEIHKVRANYLTKNNRVCYKYNQRCQERKACALNLVPVQKLFWNQSKNKNEDCWL